MAEPPVVLERHVKAIRHAADPKSRFFVWVAEGFGVGRFPYAPGTVGSFLGLIWFALLVLTGSLAGFVVGLTVGLVASVILCGVAERITGRKDPESVVLDEIAALPICFVPWLLMERSRLGQMPEANDFFDARTIWMSFLLFGLFRILDIWKPWPIRPSQKLPGGWGVTIDDVLAAAFVAGLSWLALQ
jgi:phosphatidylglycerophosphatase A